MNLLDLHLSDSTVAALERSGITTLEKALELIPGVGGTRAQEISGALAELWEGRGMVQMVPEEGEDTPQDPLDIEVPHKDTVVTVRWLLDQVRWYESQRAS